jgi:RimJ/RimL family protein N-acetyltransferase
LHIFIGAQGQRSHGYGEATMQLALAHAFGDLGLHRIYLFVLASNEAAQRLYKKCGFVDEGCLHQHAFKRGCFEDLLVMGLLSTDWKRNNLA